MSTPEQTAPKVFISYSHDSKQHEENVGTLAERLRREGVECVIDQYITTAAEGWPRWMMNQIEEADFVLVVATETYNRRFRGKEEPNRGRGAQWEGAVITQELYNANGKNLKFVPVVFNNSDVAHIPIPLHGATYYDVTVEARYDALYFYLTHQPPYVPPLGPIRKRPQTDPPSVGEITDAALSEDGRTQHQLELIHNYLDHALPRHLSEVSSVGKIGKLDKAFVALGADVREQVGIDPVLSDPDLDDEDVPDLEMEMQGELYAPREAFTGRTEFEPNIRDRIRTLRRVVLLGEPGAGKTFLLARLALDYADAYPKAGSGFLPVFVSLSKYDTSDDFETFCAERLGPLAAFVPELQSSPNRQASRKNAVLPELKSELRVVWLLDALNEMPRKRGQWQKLEKFISKLVDADISFVLTCRVKNYDQELAYVPHLYRVDLQDLNPEQIYEILTHYLSKDYARIVWQDVLRGAGMREAWQAWKGSVRLFWERPEGHSLLYLLWKEHEKVRNGVYEDPRKLLLLCRNPFTLVRLLVPRIRKAVQVAAERRQPLYPLLGRLLPNNRADLFRRVIEDMLKAEASPQKGNWASDDEGRITGMLEYTAVALQSTEQHTEMSIADLMAHPAAPVEGTLLLRKAWDAGLVTLSEAAVRFNHQLFQEYFATSLLRDLLDNYDSRYPGWEEGASLPPRDERLAELFPNWWEAGGWRVTVTLLGELAGRTGISRVVRWLASYVPEIALQCVLDNNDDVRVDDLTDKANQALIEGTRTRVAEPHPVGRAAAYRVLGHPKLDADDRRGVGLRSDGLPDIEWGKPVLPGVYPVGGDKEAYLSLPSQTVSLSYGYRLSKYPVTNVQFDAFLRADAEGYNNPAYWTSEGLKWKGDRRAPDEAGQGSFGYRNHPRVSVLWYEASAFCRWMSTRHQEMNLLAPGEEICLPTEIEWEICARGSTGLLFPYGNEFDASKGNMEHTGIGRTSAVGIFPDGASPYGVLDMSGNVWEWCITAFKSYGNKASRSADRVLRGGAWDYDDCRVRACARYSHYYIGAPDFWYRYVGFRVACLPHSVKRR